MCSDKDAKGIFLLQLRAHVGRSLLEKNFINFLNALTEKNLTGRVDRNGLVREHLLKGKYHWTADLLFILFAFRFFA